jgi:hypothetical protein
MAGVLRRPILCVNNKEPKLYEIKEETMQKSSTKQSDTKNTTKKSWRQVAWILILIADAGLLAWGAMAALAPEHLLGPGSVPILNAEYEGFTGYSWSGLAGASPMTAEFITIVFRMYGTFNVAFALMAIAILPLLSGVVTAGLGGCY